MPAINKNKPEIHQSQPSRSAPIAIRGIKTSRQFAAFTSELLADLASGNIDPQLASAMSHVSGKLLKICDMEYRYGKRKPLADGVLPLV